MSWILYLVLINILVAIGVVEELVRMDVSFKMTNTNEVYPLPVANFKADGQNIYALVDTGASFMFFVWKSWYENNNEKCDKLIFGCYECIPPCKEGPTRTVRFGDASRVKIFPHTGKMDINGEVSTLLDFGLVAGFNKEPTRIWASLGLRKTKLLDAPYESIVEQLFAKRMITGNSFSIYFTTGDNPTGEIILGGGDPSKYTGPLTYIKIVDEDEQCIQVIGLKFGDDPKDTIKMPGDAFLDTGSTHIFMNTKFKNQVITFLQTSGKKKVQIQEEGNKFSISCADAPYLPSMTFFMQGLERGEKVPLVITPENLVRERQHGVCYLLIYFANFGQLILGTSAFLGHYYYYDVDKKMIGFADVR